MHKLRLVSLGGALKLHEVHDGCTVIGIVWRHGGAWHGDADQMTAPLITDAEDSETAAYRLFAALTA